MSACPFPVISIRGNANQRGQQYGSQCKALISRAVNTYRQMFRRSSNLDWDQSLEKAAEFIPFLRGYDAEIMEEIEGISKGSGRPVEEIVALNVRTELLFILAEKNQRIRTCCTSLAVTSGPNESTGTTLAQNWDWYVQTQDFCVILKIEQAGRPDIVQLVEAGIIGKTGFNSAGIGLCANALVSNQWRVGVPFHAIIRVILNSETMAEAIGAVTRSERASAGNYLIGHASGEAINLEAAPTSLNYIFPDRGIITHSNHFKVANPRIRDFVPSLWPDSIMRDYRAGKILAEQKDRIDMKIIQRVLRDHFDKPYSICAHREEPLSVEDQHQTNASLIMELAQGNLYIAKGPPCEYRYVRLGLGSAGAS